jgi:uncharacterized spore protein YtfJ
MDIEAIATALAQTIQKEANINVVFGEPKKLDNHTIIPVARVRVTLGAGGANASGPGKVASAAEGVAVAIGAGMGAGGGLDLDVQPLGFIRDSDDGPTWVAIDPSAESMFGKVEHLLERLRPGSKSTDAGR